MIFFNINDASVDKEGLINFINENKENTDIFCFQEVFSNSEKLLNELLSEFKKFINYKWVTAPDYFSQATFISSHCEFLSLKELLQDKPNLGSAIYTKIKSKGKELDLINFHGLSRPVDKLDCPERLEQSQYLIDFFKGVGGLKIIGGDFNLFINTKSVEIFEQTGYKNLIKDFDIKNTRNEVTWKKYPESKQFFSDYVFSSSEIKVPKFKVPYNEISDHLPMILEFDL